MPIRLRDCTFLDYVTQTLVDIFVNFWIQTCVTGGILLVASASKQRSSHRDNPHRF